MRSAPDDGPGSETGSVLLPLVTPVPRHWALALAVGAAIPGAILVAAILACPARSQSAAKVPRPLTKADSGWVSLFNGKDFTGLYIRLGGTLQDPAKQNSFKIEDSVLHVPSTGGVGAIASQTIYAKYQVRVEYKFGKGQNSPNAGLLYHIDTEDWKAGQAYGSRDQTVPYLAGAYCKSVEYQMYRGDAGAFLGIVNVWVTADTKGDGNHTWQAGGTPYTAYPSNGLAERRIYRSVNAAPNDTDWVRFEGNIMGADSVTHKVNGTVVMKGRDLKHNRKLQITTKDDAEQTPMDKGHIGLQTEGAEVFYRNWEVRLLDDAGKPIIPGCRDAASPDYNPLANRDGGVCRPTTLARNTKQGAAADGRGLRGGQPGTARETAVSLLGERGHRDLRGRRHQSSYRALFLPPISTHSPGGTEEATR